jgi:hypothetical protein
VYGATESELQNATQYGLIAGGMSVFLLLWMLPKWLNSKFDWNLAPGFGLGVYSFTLGLFITFGIGVAFSYFEDNKHRKSLPRCCRSSVAKNGYECRYVTALESKTISQRSP